MKICVDLMLLGLSGLYGLSRLSKILVSVSRAILLCLGEVGLFLNFSVVIFDKDIVVRTFRVIQVVRVAIGVTVVKLTILHSN